MTTYTQSPTVPAASGAGDGLPIGPPSKIICVGLNYRDHATEAGLDAPTRPLLFAKWPNTLVGHGGEILVPEGLRTDYEAELAVVIGRRARNISSDEALDYVAGYLCANDVSARELQFDDGQWVRGKSLDTFCPIGPAMVPADQVPDPQNLGIKLWLNGILMQDSTTANMIFSVADIVSFVSQTATLEPGDIILTGTPAGVGVFRNPPVGLKDGDVVTVEIESIGKLTNRVKSVQRSTAAAGQRD
ncbi:fumarylacetoacetate hydrolase family protein [Paenarthrobacter sp. NPDC018779]|uniref:fumarylacetoacetate hydrolase family protein n=1 Tax=Paenarthrobacter sp. NPDC018779 TaxID=3364375 RepID=UPI0037C900CA